MTGKISGVKRSLSGMFWIDGDDGVTYFSHARFAKDRSNKKHYLYNGNRATFEIKDEGKEHLLAVDVWFDEVKDPDEDIKRQKRIEEAERQRINKEKKSLAYVRKLEEQVRHYQKREYADRYIRYVIQIHENGVWENYMPEGKPVIFSDCYKAQNYVKQNKPEKVQMRARKANVVKTRDGLMIQEVTK